MILPRAVLCISLLLLLVQPAKAFSAEQTVIGGHLKLLGLSYQNGPVGKESTGTLIAASQRVEVNATPTPRLELESALDNQLSYSDLTEQVTLAGQSPNRYVDLEKNWQKNHNWSNRLSIDRLNLTARSKNGDVSIGRQAIGFGRIATVSPLDVVAPFAPDVLDSDIRAGVDAIHGVHYFGLGGQIGATAVFGPEEQDNSYLITFSDNRVATDFLAIGGTLRDRAMLGFGIAGNLGPLGVKLELSHYKGKNTDSVDGDLHHRFEIGAVELWYRFDSGIVLLTEYLYNGAGTDQPEDYLDAATAATHTEGLSSLVGQQYLLIAPSWEVHPLLSLSSLIIHNLDDDSSLMRPRLQVSLDDNLSLDLYYSHNSGRKPDLLFGTIPVPRSEFGAQGDSGGMLLRWYF